MTSPEDLYALRPEEFTAARDALVKELRLAGDRETAAAIKSLRKPTATAWAVNRVAHENAAHIDDLVEAGETLRRAQRERGARALQEATSTRRRLVDALVRKALAELEGAGYSAGSAQEDELTQTFLALATDPEGLERTRGGTLERTLRPRAEFGDLASAFGSDGAEDETAPPSVQKRSDDRKARERAEELERAAGEAEDAAARASDEADRAEAQAKRTRDEAARSDRVARTARAAADRAAQTARKARERAREASE